MNLAAVLLTGGQSRRMGRDKATLFIRGIPLWRHQIGLLRALSPAALLVSARHAPAWLPPDAQFIADFLPGLGPLSGIVAALQAMRATHLLALAIDMPAMTASHLAALWDAASPGCGVLPCVEERPQPLPAIYPAESLAAATALLSGADSSLNALARSLVESGQMKTHAVDASDAYLYANCNSPADWQRHATHGAPSHD